MSKKIYLILTLIAVSHAVMSQNCNYKFSGTVKDFHNGEPIVGAVLKIEDSEKYTTTDENGKFQFSKLCSSQFIISVSHISCETRNISINLSEKLDYDIRLEHHLEELDEVKVATKRRLEKTSVQQSLSKTDIERFTDKSLGDVLNTISGVSSLNTGNSIVKPMIHGLHSSRLLIVNNNVRLFDQEWGDEHAPNIDINSGGRIEVVKGANTLIYGSDAIGGMVMIRQGNYEKKDSIFGSTMMSLNTNGWGGNLNSELIRTYESGFYTKAQASYKYFGDFKAPDYVLSNTGVRSLNASLRAGYNSFEKGFDAYYSYVNNTFGILRASHIGNTNDLVRAINSGEPQYRADFTHAIDNPKQQISHHTGKIEAYKRYEDFGKLSLQYDLQINRRREFDIRRGDNRDRPVIDLRLITHSLQPNLTIDSFDNMILNTGILLRYQNNNALATGVSPIIPDFDRYDAGTYVTSTYTLNDITELSAGFRYDFSNISATKRYRVTDWYETYNYDELFPEFDTGIIDRSRVLTHPEFSYHNFSASLGLKKKLNHNIDFLFNYGLASRMPNPSELFSDGLHHSAARIEIGKLTIGKEIANKFITSIERIDENFGFSVSPYYKYIDDFIQLIPTGTTTTIRGAFPVWEYFQVDAQIFGVDIDVNTKINENFDYVGSLSLIRGDNLSDDIPLIHMPGANFSNTITYQNSEFHQFRIGLTQRTVLKQNRYPDYNFYTFDPILQEDVYVDISSTPPTYTLFNLSSSATFKAFQKGSLRVEFNIDNLFNVSYREYLNRLRYFADELGTNFNIKLKLNY